jgi:hypothetical protein
MTRKNMWMTGGLVAVAAMLAVQVWAEEQGAAAAPAGVPAVAPAGGGHGGPGAALREALSFEKVDANADGQVSLEEYQAAMAKIAELRFKADDADGNGTLSAEEFQKAREAGPRGPRAGGHGGEGKGHKGQEQQGGQ